MTQTVSVIIATYKRENELKVALNSLSNQTYNDFEIIVVDDNADTVWNLKVEKIINNFKNCNESIKVKYIVNTSNQGSAKSRNIGIDVAVGEYITFLDDDDIYLPSKIEKQVKFMSEEQLDYSITDLYLYNENDQLEDKRIRDYIKETTPEALLRYHLMHHLTGTDCMMFRRDYLIEIGKFPPIDVGDEFYLMQFAIEGNGKFGYLPGSDVKAYVHNGEDGLSSGEGKINGENALYEYKKKYFNQLSAKEIRYIKMRHYAVIAYAYLRAAKYMKCFVNGCKSMLISPIGCLDYVLNYLCKK